MNAASLITALEGTAPPERLIVDDQSATDIVNEIIQAHHDYAHHYDLIVPFLQTENIWDTCFELWEFCKENLPYKEESGDVQNVSCPYTILTRGGKKRGMSGEGYQGNDCKSYALFIAGCCDALKRAGMRIVWKYRFVSYSLLDPAPHHVFVVVNPATEDIWIDPVLDHFDQRTFYWHKIEKSARTIGRVGASIGRAPAAIMGDCAGCCIGTTSSENALLSEVKAYADGIAPAIGQVQKTAMWNQIVDGILQGAAVAFVPYASQALAVLKVGAIAFDSVFGAGAESSRLLTAISNLNFIGLWNNIMGRTYNTDQYWAAVYYKFYVQGQNVTDIAHVTDNDILPALKWFIDRTGVFISGREHIISLTQSGNAYMNYAGVNPDTTTDPSRVAAAVSVARNFWPHPGNFNANMLGAWKPTIGVFDQMLAQLALQLGTSPESLAAKQSGGEQAQAVDYLTQQSGQQTAQANAQGQLIPGINNTMLLVGAGIIGYLLLNKK